MSRVAQLLGMVRVAAGTGFGIFQQGVRKVGAIGGGRREETGDLGEKGKHGEGTETSAEWQ